MQFLDCFGYRHITLGDAGIKEDGLRLPTLMKTAEDAIAHEYLVKIFHTELSETVVQDLEQIAQPLVEITVLVVLAKLQQNAWECE